MRTEQLDEESDINSDVELADMINSSRILLRDDLTLENVEFHVRMMFGSIDIVRYAIKIV